MLIMWRIDRGEVSQMTQNSTTLNKVFEQAISSNLGCSLEIL